MIYTLTLNPAIDYVISLEKLNTGTLNRTESESFVIGGKGINVSLVLRELGVESTALGFTAGFTGDAIENELSSSGVKCDFIRLESGFSRINIKLKCETETEINGTGPTVSEEKLKELMERLLSLRDGDTLILSGSVPPSVPRGIYSDIMKRLNEKGRKLRFIVDASGDALLGTLKYNPFLIKPNRDELEELFSAKIRSKDDALKYAKKLRELGAQNVLVSMASEGAVLLDEYGNEHYSSACRGEVKNSTGAGDSMVAGFIAACEKGGKVPDYSLALRLGTAAGGASAFSVGLAKRQDIEELYKTI